MAISIIDQFTVNAAKPIDDRLTFETLEARNALDSNLLYDGLVCFVEETGLFYYYNEGWYILINEAAFALLAGRPGGQTLYGGTGAGENLQVNSTSHETKGKTIIGDNLLVIDEVNKRVGLGILPLYSLHALGIIYSNSYIFAPLSGINEIFSFSTSSDLILSPYSYEKKIVFRSNRSGSDYLYYNTSGQEFSGLAAFYVKNGRNTSPDTPDGFDFTIEAGGATVTTNDSQGGDLYLKGGKSTGTASSAVKIQVPEAVGETADADNEFISVIEVNGSATGGKIGFFKNTPVAQQELNSYESSTLDDFEGEPTIEQLNTIVAAYNNLRASYDDLRQKLLNTTLIAETV